MAESVNALYKTELHRNPAALARNGGPWRGLDDLEIATCGWVSWFNDERIHGELDDQPPRSRRRVPSSISARSGMRNPTQRASIDPRPNHESWIRDDGGCQRSIRASDRTSDRTRTRLNGAAQLHTARLGVH